MIPTEISDLFECPQCGDNRIEEVLSGVTQATEVVNIIEKLKCLEYGTMSTDGGDFVYFQCLNCGWKLPVADVDDLCDYLHKPDRVCKPGCCKEPANESATG
jgi:predicted RNA-binding Zn-ribbon protein involved in translation (DUF1610 family)